MSFFEIVIPAQRRVVEAETLHLVEDTGERVCAVLLGQLRQECVHLALRNRPVEELVLRRDLAVLRERLLERPLDLGVEDHAAGRGQNQLVVPAVLDRRVQGDLLGLERELNFLLGLEPLGPRIEILGLHVREVGVGVGEVVPAQDHVLARRRERPAMRRGEDVVRREHQHPRLRLRLGGERKMHRHLVAVEVRVEGVADERMYLDRLALDEHGLERLNAEPVQRRCSVQEHWVLRDDLFEHVPHLGHH